MANPLRAAAARRRSIIGLDNTGSTGLQYTGAQFTRLTEDWIWAPIASADEEVRWDIYRLRARARDLRRNNPYAARFVQMVGENVIGHEGIRLQAMVANASGKPDTPNNNRIEDGWAEWSAPENASTTGELSWTDLQWLAVQTMACDGEAMFRIVRGYPNRFGMALETIDVDRLDHTYNRAPSKTENEIRMGVEVDVWGRRVAYWLWDHHPYDINAVEQRERVRVPADDIIFLRMPARPGQTRSVTWFAPVMLPIRMLQGFAEAELVAARTAASAMGFYIQDPEGIDDPNSPAGEGEMTLEAEPGTMVELPPNIKDVKMFSPQHPNVAFDAFVKGVVRWVAGGLNVSYNALGNDLESVNYSSIRAGLIAERDHWRHLQTFVTTHLHRRVYREFVKWGVTSGAIELSGRNVERWFRHRWLPRGWPWVDPLKDITAAAASVQLSFNSRQRLLAEEGRDFETVLADLRDEKSLAEDYGIDLINTIMAGRITEKSGADVSQTGDVMPAAPVAPVAPADSDKEPTDEEGDAEAGRMLAAVLASRNHNGNGHHAL